VSPPVKRRSFSLILAAIGGIGLSVAQTPVRYDVVLPEHLAKASAGTCSLPKNLRAKAPSVVSSPHGNWSATVQETDPVAVPYDQARACIQLRGPGGVVRGVTLGDFRTLRLQWVNERMLYIETDVGHVAGVGQLLDVEDLRWLYARTEYYSSPRPA